MASQFTSIPLPASVAGPWGKALAGSDMIVGPELADDATIRSLDLDPGSPSRLPGMGFFMISMERLAGREKEA